MSTDVTRMCLTEFITTFRASLDPRLWAKLVREETAELEAELAKDERDKIAILKEASDLMYVTVGFNLVSAGPEYFGLFSEEEHAEFMLMLEKSTEIHSQAIEYLGDIQYVEAFRRVHLGHPLLRKWVLAS